MTTGPRQIPVKPALILLCCLLAGCATMDKSECRTADWRAVGFEDGAAGRPVSHIGQHRRACAEHGVAPELAAYRNGHAEGARHFCNPANGFRQGRAGREYSGLCPADLEDEFVSAHATGRHLYDLQREIDRLLGEAQDMREDLENLRRRRDNLEGLLAAGGLSTRDRELLLEQYRELQSAIALREADVRDFELEAARLQGEYRALNAAHGY
jgi:outer membrane murein-binding lipoprotein Lpp